jgi:energy-coupling factor transporter ATP-binding protein EcfA2
MIRHFYIDNFKSLVDFHLPPEPARLADFTCLIGMNGAGKSTILQAFDFIKQLMHGRIDEWLEVREWERSDLTSRYTRKRLIMFKLTIELPRHPLVTWEGSFNSTGLRCTAESITYGESTCLRLADGVVNYIEADSNEFLQAQGFTFQGSVLSAMRLDRAHPAIQIIRAFVRGLKSLDMLAPNLMRKRSREAEDVGYGGERLSAFLHGFLGTGKRRLLEKLKNFYPQLSRLETSSMRSGWKDLHGYENYDGNDFSVGFRHLNDGMLRVLAIISQVEAENQWQNNANAEKLAKKAGYTTHKEYRVLLFDEIENGIHPELIEKLVAYLLESQRQIIVTTHSPMLLNYLPDDVAKEAVILLYRTPDGITRSVRYFDLPSARKKLDLLGPGEVFVDTDLATLTREAEALRNA